MTKISRRKFIQLTVLSGAAAAAGCKNHATYNEEVAGRYGGTNDRVRPYVNQPDGLQDGIPQYFATTCRMCPAGCGLLARTIGGRAVKVEGNPSHPVNTGATCARGQASLQRLYNPDRLRFPILRAGRWDPERTVDWETALSRTIQGLRDAKGRTVLLADKITVGQSPSLMGIVNEFAAATKASVAAYSLLDDSPARTAAQAAYGRNQLAAYQLDQADVILSFSSDFLEAWPSPVYYGRLYGEFRQGPRRRFGEHGRFIYIGPRMSMTAAKADVWLPCHPGTESAVAQGILTALGGGGIGIERAASISGLTPKQITAAAQAFSSAGTRAVAIGDGLAISPNATRAITTVNALNVQVHSQCVGFGEPGMPFQTNGSSGYRQTERLVADSAAGRIGALLILGEPNPVFTLPAASGFEAALRRIPFIAAITPFEDETTAYADVVLPARTFLEDWGDNIPSVIPPVAAMASLQQPVIDPQFITVDNGESAGATLLPWMDSRPTGDVLLELGRRLSPSVSAMTMETTVRRSWAGIGHADLTRADPHDDPKWAAALSNGGFWGAAAISPRFVNPRPQYSGPTGPPASGQYSLYLYPHIYWTDGRHANLPWLQEIPDPMTAAVWNSWVEINREEANRLGIHTGDIVRVTSAHGSLEAPAVPYPAIHPQVIAMPLSQGHLKEKYGRYAGRGTNPLQIANAITDPETGALAFNGTPVQIVKLQSAKPDYHPGETLVLSQDRPGGSEPEAVKDLIHTTAREARLNGK